LLYAVYRTRFQEDFHFGATTLDPVVGTLNTLILLTSSLTMALSVAALERGRWRLSCHALGATLLLGLVFLVNKAFEWSAKISHGLYPRSDQLLEHTDGENLFYGLYYGMTGLHALHVVAGIGVLGVMLLLLRRARRGRTAGEEEIGAGIREAAGVKLENAGLYWHLVDVIWIFLFPLFYLIS
jgi:cytochrome c oxidase subunit 3